MSWLRALLPGYGWLTGHFASVSAAAAVGMRRIASGLCSSSNQQSLLLSRSSQQTNLPYSCSSSGRDASCSSRANISGVSACDSSMECTKVNGGMLLCDHQPLHQAHDARAAGLAGHQQQQQQQWQVAALPLNHQQLFHHEWQQQQWQQLRLQQLLPFFCTAHSSSSSSSMTLHQLLLLRGVFTSAENRRVGVRRAGLDELTAALQQLGLTAAAVQAVTAAAPSWPSLSKDAHEIPQRVVQLQGLVGSTTAAADMLASHPHLLTRPPTALEQQLVNLAVWLRLPIAGSSSSSSMPGCQDLMDLVRSSPAVLFLSQQQVMSQLQAIQQLLQLPSLPHLAEEEVAVSEQLLAEAQHLQQQQQQQQPQSGDAVVVAAAAAEQIEWAEEELHSWKQQQHKQMQQVKAALKHWRKQQQQHGEAAAAAAVDDVAQLPWDSWPGRLVCRSPEWLFLDPHTVLQQRIDYLARVLFGSSIIKPTSSSSSHTGSSSSSISIVRKVQALLFDVPQLIAVGSSQIPAKIRSLSKVVEQHPAYALMQQQQQQPAQTAKPNLQQQQQQKQTDASVVAFILQNPSLLVQSAKHLQRNGTALLQQLPVLPLYHLLLLLPQQHLQWQQLEYLQHMLLLPTAQPSSAAAAAVQLESSSSSSSSGSRAQLIHLQQQQQPDRRLPQQPWTEDQLQLATDALSLLPVQFSVKFPLYTAWQAAAAAAAQSATDWRSGWRWSTEFKQQLAGPRFEAWLQGMAGRWQRLLLLAAGQQWISHVQHNLPASQLPTAAAAAIGSSSNMRSSPTRRRKSRVTGESLAAPAAPAGLHSAGPGSQAGLRNLSVTGLTLQQIAQLPGETFPFRPVASIGPLPFDLPDAAVQQLLISSRSGLDHHLACMSKVWQQVAAAAGLSEVWRQQLEDVAVLLPQALVAAGWKLPAAVIEGLSRSSSSSSWIDSSMDSRSDSNQAAAAAAAARHQFWQHLQQPAVADRLVARLQYLHQAGLTTPSSALYANRAAAAAVAAEGHTPSFNVPDSQQLWSVLVPSDAAFATAHPTFQTWASLQQLVQGKPAWTQELASYTDQELLQFLQAAAAGWDRLCFLVADSLSDSSAGGSSSSSSGDGGGGGLWQGISMTDALSFSREAFLEMFPEARYNSWQAIAAFKKSGSSSSSSSSLRTLDQGDRSAAPAAGWKAGAPGATDAVHASTAATTAAAAEAAAASSSSSSSISRPGRSQLSTTVAAQRLQLVQDYAAMHPAWETAIRSWSAQTWSNVAKVFVPLRARRLDFILQTAESHTEVHSDSTASGTGSSSAVLAVPDFHNSVMSANKHFEQKFPLFKPWQELGLLIQAVPRWAAQWQGLRGAQLKQVLSTVVDLQPADPDIIYQQAYDQHFALLQEKIQQQNGSNSSSSSSELSKLLKHAKLPRVGVTHFHASSRSSGINSSSSCGERDASAASEARSSSNRKAANAAAAAGQQQRHLAPELSGLSLALSRLSHVRKLHYNHPARGIPLTQLLTVPQLQLWEALPSSAPALTAAKTRGTAAAEADVLAEAYPWLGVHALNPEVLDGLSPAGKRLLDERREDLLVLQQLAHTWPEWEQQLQGFTAAALEDALQRMATRADRLQVLVRAGIQRYNSLRSVMRMDERAWRARYPIADQLAEVQAAAAGVAAWERALSHSPSGRQLLRTINKLHARRGRLVWLAEEGFTEQGALQVLRMTDALFLKLYPDYPGDAAMRRKLGSDVGSAESGFEELPEEDLELPCEDVPAAAATSTGDVASDLQ